MKSKTVWLKLALCLAVLSVLLLAKLDIFRKTEVFERLLDAGHLPLFFAFTLGLMLVLAELPISRGRLAAIVGIVSLLLAPLFEMLQGYAERSPSGVDLVNGWIGSALALYFYFVRQRPLFFKAFFVIIFLGSSMIVLEPAYKALKVFRYRESIFPILADFDKPDQIRFFQPQRIAGADPVKIQVGLPNALESYGLALEIQTSAGSYQGIRFRGEDFDWSGYGTFTFSIFNPAIFSPGEQFNLHLRIDDDGNCKEYNDRFNRVFKVSQGWNEFQVPISEIHTMSNERELNLRRVRRVYFFTGENESARLFYLDNLKLQK